MGVTVICRLNVSMSNSFLSLLFSDRNWRRSNASLIRQLTKTTSHVETKHEPCPLPSEPEGRDLFER